MGKGAFSSVIRAMSSKTGKECAIKVIDKKFLEKVRLLNINIEGKKITSCLYRKRNFNIA